MIEHSQNISLKVDTHEIDGMRQLLAALPKVEDIEAQRTYLAENIQKFHEDNEQFHVDFQKQNEIIRRYDEVLN